MTMSFNFDSFWSYQQFFLFSHSPLNWLIRSPTHFKNFTPNSPLTKANKQNIRTSNNILFSFWMCEFCCWFYLYWTLYLEHLHCISVLIKLYYTMKILIQPIFLYVLWIKVSMANIVIIAVPKSIILRRR